MIPSVSIIVLNWNGKHHLEECLDSLSHLDYPAYKVVLVDNASTDGSVEWVASHYPQVHILRNQKNLGFAEGNNVGIRFALSEGAGYVVLVNTDTRAERDFLTHLVQRGEEDKEIGVLGGKVLMFFDPRVVNSTGVNLNQLAYGWDRDFGEEAQRIVRKRGEVLAVTGTLMAIKAGVFEKVGLLDPEFFAYYEDVDFCVRVWKHTHFRVEYVPESIIYHKFSASVSGESALKQYLMFKNQFRIFFKHFPPAEMVRAFPLLLLHRFRTLLGHLKGGDLSLIFAEFLVMLKYVTLFPLLFFLRIPDAVKKGVEERRFWEKVVPEKRMPSFKPFSPEYGQVILDKKEIRANKIQSRIIMGVNDNILGEGWSRLMPDLPRTRRMGQKAVFFLRNEKRFGYIQIHGLWESIRDNPWLDVVIEGQIVGQRQVEFGWHTYIIPFENRFQEGPVEMNLRIKSSGSFPEIEKGFGVNEIGLFSLGSPLLRWVEN
jgi:GT2 family glycosyltransferase